MEHNQESTKLLFVINPVSGANENTDWEAGIRQYFKDSAHQLGIVLLTGKNDALTVYDKIKAWQPDKVIAVGGDGTIKLAAEQMVGTDIPLGIVPAGSANGLAAEMKLPSGLNDALEVAMKGIVRKTDLIKINDREICIHLSDMGLNAKVVKYYAMGGVRGKWGYAKAILRVLWQRQLIKTEIQINGEKLTRYAFMIVLANSRTYGTGAIINPDGDIGDGKFEVVIVKELSVWELLKMMITHKPFDPRKIEILRTDEVSISIRRRAYFQVDGEYRGKLTLVRAKILPAAVNLVFPAED